MASFGVSSITCMFSGLCDYLHPGRIEYGVHQFVGRQLGYAVRGNPFQLCAGNCHSRMVVREGTHGRCSHSCQRFGISFYHPIYSDWSNGSNDHATCQPEHARVNDVWYLRNCHANLCIYFCILHRWAWNSFILCLEKNELDGKRHVFEEYSQHVCRLPPILDFLVFLHW